MPMPGPALQEQAENKEGGGGMPGRVCGKPGPGLSRRQPHVGQQGRSPGQPSTCYTRGRYF